MPGPGVAVTQCPTRGADQRRLPAGFAKGFGPRWPLDGRVPTDRGGSPVCCVSRRPFLTGATFPVALPLVFPVPMAGAGVAAVEFLRLGAA